MHVLASGCPPVGAEPVWTPSGSSTMTERSVFTSSFKSSTWVCNSLILALVSLFFSVVVLILSHPKKLPSSSHSPSRRLLMFVGKNTHEFDLGMEPPARIELATSSLPMRCYTTKPRWRCPCHQPFRYNRFASHPIFANSCNIWRRERDLNSRGTGHAISSRAHYQAMRSRLAISANRHHRLTLSLVNGATQQTQR